MRNYFLLAVLALFTTIDLCAQMYVGNDTLYGNEWIDYEKTHLKFTVEEQGIYRINFSDIQNDLPQGVRGDELKLFNYGEEQHIYITETGPLSSEDYILFYGIANDGRLDAYLYDQYNTANQINPHYSFYTDKNAYFLVPSVSSDEYLYTSSNPINTSGLDAETKLYSYERKSITDTHNKKTEGNRKLSLFDETENYGSTLNTSGSFSINAANPNSGDDAELVFHYLSHEGGQVYNFELNNELLTQKEVFQKGVYKDSISLNLDQLPEVNTFSFQGENSELYKISLSLLELWFNTNPSLIERPYLYFESNVVGDKLYKINSNLNENHILLDIENKEILFPDNNNGSVSFGLESKAKRNLFLSKESSINTLETYRAIDFINFSDNQGELLIIYNELLALENNGNNVIEEYANYHRNESPYTKTVSTAEIQQITDQFAYGILLHPMGIRNIGHYFHHNSDAFKHLLLIGKPIRHTGYRKASDFENTYGTIFFLPTIGEFSSDNLFTSNNIDYRPQFSVGRIAAITSAQVRNYLEKLKEYEMVKSQPQSFENKLWTKRVLHLVGGDTDQEESSIFNYLTSAENILEQNLFGADVRTFRKYHSGTVVTESFGFIQDQVNKGLSIINVFGHSSANFTQYGINDINIYDNKGKYPLIMSGGCYSGTCSNNIPALGENLTLTKDKAGIGYMGVSGFGFISELGSFMNNLYKSIGEEKYGYSIGEALQNTYNQFGNSPKVILQQIIFQGDPSIRFYYHDKPDYTIGQDLEVLTTNLTTSLDSFDIKIPLYNLGKSIDTTVVINFSIKYPNNEEVYLFNDTIQAPKYLSEITYKIPVIDKEKIAGLNRLLIKIDAFNEVEEQSNGGEANNKLIYTDNLEGFPILFTSNDLSPILPFNFHQKTEDNFTLFSTSNNINEYETSYLLEIDTSNFFNSPIKFNLQQSSKGGLLEWTNVPPFNSEEVYYWRTAASPTENTEIIWNNSSFYVANSNSEGWHQSHFQQIEQDTLINFDIDSSSKKLKFKEDLLYLSILNIVAQPGAYPVVTSDFGRYFLYYSPSNPVGVGFVIIDPDNLQCVQNLENNGQEQIYAYPWANGEGHIFNTSTPEQREEVVNFMNNVIPEGSYVAFMTLQFDPNQDYKPEEWEEDASVYGSSIFQALENKGSIIVRDLENTGSVPYGFIYQEGNSDFQTSEVISNNPFNYSYTTVQVEGNFNQGYLKSQHIGPASSWGRLKYELSDVETNDSTSVSLYGIDTFNNIQLLNSYTEASMDEDISQLVDAKIYPEIYLNYFVSDPVNTTVPNLKYWTVEFEGVPEVAVAPNLEFELKDTIYKGEQLNFQLAAKNISDYDMDSLLVKTTFIDQNRNSEVLYKRFAPVSASDIITLEDVYESTNFSGLTRLIVELNPNEDQAELNHSNNIFSTEVLILEDRIDPLLSVRFDGKRIIDGDLVSPSPLISISIKDDNPDLLLNDTSYFDIKIKYVNNEVQTIYFDEAGLVFQPADDASNTATIEFQRDFEEDGIYTLYIAAKDASGNSISSLSESPDNISAGMDYKIDFEVINKSMISNFYNYPNPFSNATRFVYTLTGDKIPSYFKVQILTASGKLVREINQAEFGPLLPGTHQSEFVWDGRDQYGDQLANGVYLYKIIAKDENGDNFEKYDLNDSESLHFLNGFGKMVLVR